MKHYPLKVLAGAAAYRHIQQHGLQPEHISAALGASGAAKWLTICGLDRAIFTEWLPTSARPVDLLGTSVGAFKLAAAAMAEPAAALSRLAEAYVQQSYVNDFSLQAVDRETQKILRSLLGTYGAEEVLANHHYRFHCGAIWSHGWLGSRHRQLQRLAMCKAFLHAVKGRASLATQLGRIIFSVPGSADALAIGDDFITHHVELTAGNFAAALLASGSIPVVMRGVTDIAGAPEYVYRDGGLLDYHPLPDNLLAAKPQPGQDLILYPHFYAQLTESWFDKFFRRRKVAAERLDKVVLICPTAEFVSSLPEGRIPDRQDFYRYKHDDARRQAQWREVVARSEELGDAWRQLTRSGNIAGLVQRIL